MAFVQLISLVHTALSVVGFIAGILVVKGLIASAGRQLWTWLFFVTALATTLTGFLFPFQGVTPAFMLGLISLIPLFLMYVARYRRRLNGAWRGTYVVTTVMVFYFNCVVLVVQAFRHVPFLNLLAPTQTEPPFQMAQLFTLIICLTAGAVSFGKYQPKKSEQEPSAYISPHPEAE